MCQKLTEKEVNLTLYEFINWLEVRVQVLEYPEEEQTSQWASSDEAALPVQITVFTVA